MRWILFFISVGWAVAFGVKLYKSWASGETGRRSGLFVNQYQEGANTTIRRSEFPMQFFGLLLLDLLLVVAGLSGAIAVWWLPAHKIPF